MGEMCATRIKCLKFDIMSGMNSPPNEDEKLERLRRAMYSRSQSPKLKDRPRRVLEEDPALVGEDWQRPEQEISGSIIAPRSISVGRGAMRWLLIAGVAFAVGAAVFFAYYFTLGGGAGPSSPGNIGISISGPPSVPGGEPVELQISVSNQNRSALQSADLVLTYPPGTRLSNAPLDVPSKRISLGSIASGDVRQIPVRAVFAGAEGTRANVKAELEYRLAGSSAIFVASSNYEITFSSSPLSLSVEGNNETVSGQPVEITATVHSNAVAPIKDVLLSASYPFGFAFSGSEPNPARAGVWELGDITPGKSVKISIRGTLTGESGDERVFRIAIGTRKTAASTNIDTTIAENSSRMVISRPFLGLGVSVNKESGANVIVAPGETVDVSIDWQNNLSTAITDAVIVARLSGLAIDGQTVKSLDGFYRSSDSAILWDKTTTSGALSNLASGGRGTVNFSFNMPERESLQALHNPRLTITVHAAGKRLSESGVPENLQATAARTIKLASNLEILTQGLYYQNPFGSTGPMPPKAEAETTYAIALGITNTTNKIRSAKLTATLPTYVRWLGIYMPSSSEAVTFNKSEGTVTWNVGDIASGVGVSGTQPRQIAFAIGFTPSTSQIGQTPPLLQNISLTGIDAETGVAVSPKARDVTTNILGDSGFNSSDATVVR